MLFLTIFLGIFGHTGITRMGKTWGGMLEMCLGHVSRSNDLSNDVVLCYDVIENSSCSCCYGDDFTCK